MLTFKHILIAAVAFIVLVVLFFVYRRIPKKLNQKKIESQWKKIQIFCRDKATWPKAITEADNLLKKSLKRRQFKGKSMGEKMASAQRLFTDNDGLWYAHNLYKKLGDKPNKKLRESEVKDALIGYRQALRDLGGLPGNEAKK